MWAWLRISCNSHEHVIVFIDSISNVYNIQKQYIYSRPSLIRPHLLKGHSSYKATPLIRQHLLQGHTSYKATPLIRSLFLSGNTSYKATPLIRPLLLLGHSSYKATPLMGDFQKNEDFSFSDNNLNIKWYERKVNILKQAQW